MDCEQGGHDAAGGWVAGDAAVHQVQVGGIAAGHGGVVVLGHGEAVGLGELCRGVVRWMESVRE